MHILIAPDSFKDALPAPQVAEAIARGLERAHPEITTHCFPLADGGEGTAEILNWHAHGEWVELDVRGPLGNPVQAGYSWVERTATAYLDMAQAAGLQLVPSAERNPWESSTFGFGTMIADAIRRGARRLVLGIGGSATNDAGLGMAHALGYQLQDEWGQSLAGTGGDLLRLRRIIPPIARPWQSLKIEVLCDVINPLYGPGGAAHVYATQKGADAEMIEQLDDGLRNFAEVCDRYLKQLVDEIPGGGAAGGLGAGLAALLGGQLKSGIELVMDITNFEQALTKADVVITGEGKIDRQSLSGKLIQGISKRASQQQVPVIACCGYLDAEADAVRDLGLLAAFSIQRRPLSLSSALEETAFGLEQQGFHIGRLLANKV